MQRFKTFAAAVLFLAGDHPFTVKDSNVPPARIDYPYETASQMVDVAIECNDRHEITYYTVESGDAHLGYIVVFFSQKGEVLGVWA